MDHRRRNAREGWGRREEGEMDGGRDVEFPLSKRRMTLAWEASALPQAHRRQGDARPCLQGRLINSHEGCYEVYLRRSSLQVS